MKRILVMASIAAAFSAVGLSVASAHGATTTVKVLLAPAGNNDRLKVLTPTAKAGRITFAVLNQGNLAHGSTYGVPNHPEGHELVILRTNQPPGKLHTNAAGDAVETGRVGKPLLLDPGKSGSITLTLKPGN
ncbi:MAG TPA: hypothetical protein VK576_11975, partial [Thermoleophilia bacterium]|nr:hypothetical protein [Thermoleophilia bacterium]